MFGLDWSLLTVPAIAAVSVFVAALLLGQNVVIEKIEVPYQLQWSGYNADVATRQFTDAMREMNEGAASELADLEIDPTNLQEGLGRFESYFEISLLINGARNVLGLIPYYVEGEIAEAHGEEVLTIRVFTEDPNQPVFVSITKGDPNNMDALMRQAAADVLERINPYVVVLYYRQTELAANQFDFPKTKAAADRYFAAEPVDKHFLMYGLLGRMHMLKAERDKTLTADQKQAEYDEAMKNLEAALRQHEDFLYPHINIALIESLRGRNDLAEQYYARAVEIDPNYLTTRKLWGDLLMKEGRFQDAAFQYVAAVEIDRTNAALRDKLAQIYLALGQPDAARAQWEEALRISPLTLAYANSIRDLDNGPPTTTPSDKCKPGAAAPC
jgi:tetratricopeptide (TPR) repeat protein